MSKGFNPYEEGEIYRYLICIDDAGKNKDKLVETIWRICGGTRDQAESFVSLLDDQLISNDIVCSVEAPSQAADIKGKLERAGAFVSIYNVSGYEVFLKNTGPSKLYVIKEIKDGCGIDLKEAKERVDSAEHSFYFGGPIAMFPSYAKAYSLKEKLEKVGARASIGATKGDIVEELPSEEKQEKQERKSAFSLEQVLGGTRYFCVIDGKSFGPVTYLQLSNMARFNIIDKTSLIWKEGMSSWAPISAMPELDAIM